MGCFHRERSHIRGCFPFPACGASPSACVTVSSERSFAAIDFTLAARQWYFKLSRLLLFLIFWVQMQITHLSLLSCFQSAAEKGDAQFISSWAKSFCHSKELFHLSVYTQTQRGNTLLSQLWWLWIIYLLKLFLSVCPALPVPFWGHSGNKESVITVSVCSVLPLCDQGMLFIPVPVILRLSLCLKRGFFTRSGITVSYYKAHLGPDPREIIIQML